MTKKPSEHLELSHTCRNDVGTSINPSAMASPFFRETQKLPLVSVVILRWNQCGLPITKFASTSCLSQTYLLVGQVHYGALNSSTLKIRINPPYCPSRSILTPPSCSPHPKRGRGGNFLLIQLLAKTTKQTLHYVLLFLFYRVFLPNLTLQIPSHSFVNVTFFSSTNK